MEKRRVTVWPKLIGGLLGATLAGYFVIYEPMQRNYAECGRVTLCDNALKGEGE